MKSKFMLVLVTALVLAGCRKGNPTAPTQAPADIATTPSGSSPVIRISIEKVGTTRMDVIIAENINLGLDRVITDINGALIQMVNFSCPSTNNKGLAVIVEYPNGKNATTGKNEIHLEKQAICGGKVDFGVRADPFVSSLPHHANDWSNFSFPNRSQLQISAGFTVDSEKQADGFWHIKG